jgi:hypothetical protein
MEVLQLKKGLQADYDRLGYKDPNTIYFTTDTKRIYIGDDEFSRPTEVLQTLSFNGGSDTSYDSIVVVQKQEED